jgi:superfamily II DNA or RNA helicase
MYCTGKGMCSEQDCTFCYNRSFASHPRAKDWSITKNTTTPRDVTLYNNNKYIFNCDDCNHEFSIRTDSITLNGSWCSKCQRKTEKKVYEYLKSIYPIIQHNVTFDWCKSDETNHFYPFDLCIEELKLIIEIDGPQHKRQIWNWKSPENQIKRDNYKDLCARDNGYIVLRLLQEDIWHDRYDWKTFIVDFIHNMSNLILIKKYKYGYAIKKSSINDQLMNQLKLTVLPKTIQGYGAKPKPIIMYRETQNSMIIPYYYGDELFKHMTNVNYVVQDEITHDTSIDFVGTMRPHQITVIDEVMEHFKFNHRCLLNLPCGFGKSICTLKLITLLNKKTLIIVHKYFLMEQWHDYIKLFIPNAKIGFICQDKFEPDADIIIGMLQSICSRKYPKINDIALTVIDEAHNICASVFSTALFKFSSLYMIGLSATPERKSDGLGCILEWTFGKFITVTKERDQDVHVRIVETNIKIQEKLLRFTGKLNIQDAINQLTTNPKRNQLIIEHIIANKHRNILVVTDRVQHVKTLQQSLSNLVVQSSIFIGGMTQKDRLEATNSNILIATYQMVKEGFDLPKLDVLLFATPKREITQVSGRIIRKIHEVPPVIIDMYDKSSVFERWGYDRFKYYKQNTFKFDKELAPEPEIETVEYIFDDSE